MNTNANVEKSLTTLRIIIGAMTGGMIAFGAVAIFLGRQADEPELARPLLLVLLAVALGLIPGYVAVRVTLRNKLRRLFTLHRPTEDPTGNLLQILTTVTIVGAALAEGIGLFGLTVYLITGAEWALIAPGLAFVVLVVQLPSRDKVTRFVSDVTGRQWP